MERKHGWKPLPVILKIIWILLLIGAFFSLFSVFTAPQSGYSLFGQTIYGLWAANSMFIVNILLPVVLLIAMFNRYRWTWIYGAVLYLLLIINESFIFKGMDATINQIMSQFPEEYFELVPNMPQIMKLSFIVGTIIGLLIDVFFMVMFIMKRKYFIGNDPLPLQDTIIKADGENI